MPRDGGDEDQQHQPARRLGRAPHQPSSPRGAASSRERLAWSYSASLSCPLGVRGPTGVPAATPARLECPDGAVLPGGTRGLGNSGRAGRAPRASARRDGHVAHHPRELVELDGRPGWPARRAPRGRARWPGPSPASGTPPIITKMAPGMSQPNSMPPPRVGRRRRRGSSSRGSGTAPATPGPPAHVRIAEAGAFQSIRPGAQEAQGKGQEHDHVDALGALHRDL